LQIMKGIRRRRHVSRRANSPPGPGRTRTGRPTGNCTRPRSFSGCRHSRTMQAWTASLERR